VVDIRLFNKDGQNLSKATERSIENIFFREDFRRVSFDDLGLIDEVSGQPERRYTEGFLKALNVDAIRAAHFNLVVDYASASTALVLPKILSELDCTVVALNERIDETKMAVPSDVFQRGLDQLAGITATVHADLGVRLDVSGERVWFVDGKGRKLSGTTTAAAFLELSLRAQAEGTARTVAVMANQPQLFDEIAARHGAQIRRTKIDPQALMAAIMGDEVCLALSGAGEFIVPSFHRLLDAIFPVAKMLEYLATQRTTLIDVVESLPSYHVAQRVIPCAWDQKGTVMRLLNEQYKDRIVEQVDGVRIWSADHEWALVVPEADEPVFYIFTEGPTDDAATALADRYARVIEGLRA
jgi:mannose-1-phosphate guanylyltransferase/phosphomannomutase